VEKQTTEGTTESSPTWATLEAFARKGIQELLQRVLQEEVTELLGREKSERKSPVDARAGYRNGHGKPRRLSMLAGTITVRRPRVRGLDGRFASRILPLFKRRTEQMGELLPELYLHGLAEGDFDLALRGLLGEGAPLSASSIARLKEGWQAEFEEWRRRPLGELEVVYLWADGIYVKAGLEKEKAAVLVVIGALRDGTKVVLALESGHRESAESWAAVLRDLKRRGLNAARCLVADGHLGIWAGLAQVYPDVAEQRCWNHRIVNVLDKVVKRSQPQARLMLKAIPYATTRAEAERLKGKFQAWCEKKGFRDAAKLIDVDWERMGTFYSFPLEHWKHLRTSNVVESPFAAVRLRTTAAKRYKRVENATAVIWKTLLVAEKSFRRLDHPELLSEVAEGATYVDGVRVRRNETEEAA
jgi:transposase-like protein